MENYQVIWRGPVLDSTGYGAASREYALALHRQGFDIKIETYTWGYPSKSIEKDKREQLLILMHKPIDINKQKLLILHSPPGNIDLGENRQKFNRTILYTAWETTKIPKPMIPTIQSFDAVCVPSFQNMKTMINSGVNIPLYHVPHGVDTRMFTPGNKKFLLNNANGRFVFVSIFDFIHRKNPETLLRAYWEEFSSNDLVLLLIKTYGGSRKKIISNVNQYKRLLGYGNETAPLVIITGIIGEEELKGIYTLGNVFVLPTRGEGAGLPFMEALSSGLPVISTGWGGQMDFIHEHNSFLVDYELSPVKNRINDEQAIAPFKNELVENEKELWADANVTDLKKQMRYAYKNPELCKQKGERGRKDMLKMTWDQAGETLKHAILDVIGSRA